MSLGAHANKWGNRMASSYLAFSPLLGKRAGGDSGTSCDAPLPDFSVSEKLEWWESTLRFESKPRLTHGVCGSAARGGSWVRFQELGVESSQTPKSLVSMGGAP